MQKNNQVVQYYDLFNHENIVNAPNKLQSKAIVLRAYLNLSEEVFNEIFTGEKSIADLTKVEKEIYYQQKALHSKCRCNHYNGHGGMCTFHTCRHGPRDHP